MKKKISQNFLIKIIGIIIFLWLSGFVVFIYDLLSFSSIPPLTDGIVVLTGGTGRIHTAIRFLEKDCSQYLLISGVGATTTLQDLKNSITNFPAINFFILK